MNVYASFRKKFTNKNEKRVNSDDYDGGSAANLKVFKN